MVAKLFLHQWSKERYRSESRTLIRARGWARRPSGSAREYFRSHDPPELLLSLRWAHFVACVRIGLKYDESAGKNPNNRMVTGSGRSRTLHSSAHSARRAPGRRGLRFRGVGDCRSSDLPPCGSGIVGRSCMVGSFSKIRSPAFAKAVLDALDRRVG